MPYGISECYFLKSLIMVFHWFSQVGQVCIRIFNLKMTFLIWSLQSLQMFTHPLHSVKFSDWQRRNFVVFNIQVWIKMTHFQNNLGFIHWSVNKEKFRNLVGLLGLRSLPSIDPFLWVKMSKIAISCVSLGIRTLLDFSKQPG